MNDETMQNEQAEEIPAEETQTQENATPEDKKMSDAIRARLKSATKARTEAEARAAKAEADLQALRQEHEMMQNLKKSESPQAPGMVSIDEVKKIMEQGSMQAQQQAKIHSMMQKINAATEQDPELEELRRTGNDLNPIIPLMSELDHIPNIAAVAKHLLKDKADYAVLKYSTPGQMVQQINTISKQLAGLEPKASGYKPSQQLSEPEGETGDISAVEYIYGKKK